jgi:hypothetical protein
LPRPRPAATSAQAEALRRQAAHFGQLGSPLYERLGARLALDPTPAAAILDGDDGWDVGLRLFSGVHHLVLTGVAPDALSGDWGDFVTALEVHQEALRAWMVEQGV